MEQARETKLRGCDLYRMAEAAQDAERERKLRVLAQEREEEEQASAGDHRGELVRPTCR